MVKRHQMINRFLGAFRRALWCLSVCAVSMGAAAQAPLGDEERDDDDEPNQHSIIEPIGTESDRSQWFFEGAELVLKPRTYYLHRDYDAANTREGLALGGALEFRSGW